MNPSDTRFAIASLPTDAETLALIGRQAEFLADRMVGHHTHPETWAVTHRQILSALIDFAILEAA